MTTRTTDLKGLRGSHTSEGVIDHWKKPTWFRDTLQDAKGHAADMEAWFEDSLR
jgi:hypothetical protein